MEAPEPGRASLRDFLGVIFRRKLQILFVLIVAFCTAVVITFITAPTYEANAQILVKRGIEGIYVPATGSPSPVLSINREAQINSEIEILKSRSLAKEVVDSLGPASIFPKHNSRNRRILASIFGRSGDQKSPAEKARVAIQKRLNVAAIDKSNIISVSFRHTDPTIAAAVVNALTELYLDRHTDLYHENYKLFLTKLDESRVSDAIKSDKISNASIIESAQIPLKPVRPRIMLNLGLGLLLGALGGLGLAFFLHFMDDSLEAVEDVEKCLDVPVLISIPYDKKKGA